MSNSSKDEEKKSDNDKVSVEPAQVLSNIPGVGPKTAEKLVESGYDDLKKITTADPAKLAEAVTGLSIPKAEGVIEEAKTLLKDIESGAVDITGKPKKSKRKKAPEPEPEKHELPPMEEITRSESRTSLESGFEKDKADMGIPIGPKSLTKFEKARIIGARALQISMGAPVLIDSKKAPKGLFALAEVELKLGALPMTVRRTLPTGEFADVALSILLKNTRLG